MTYQVKNMALAVYEVRDELGAYIGVIREVQEGWRSCCWTGSALEFRSFPTQAEAVQALRQAVGR